MNRSAGFTTIWLVLILATLTLFLLIVVEASAGYAASDMGANICRVAGRSILSEYSSALFDRYGIFALRSQESRLSNAGAYYIDESLESDKSLVRMSLKECRVTGEEYPALDCEEFMAQIRPLGSVMGVESIAAQNTLSGLISGLLGASEFAGPLQEDRLRELNGILESESGESAGLSDALPGEASSESVDSLLLKEKAESLQAERSDAQNPDFDGKEGGSVPGGIKQGLPSTLLEIGPTLSLLLSGGAFDVSADAIIAGEYILSMCSNELKALKNSVLSCEVEYILYGHGSDKQNSRAAKLSLFELRSVINLSEIYSDAAKLAEINAEALAFAPLPQPLAAFMIASVRAGIKAKEDVETLCAGGRVPLAKGLSLGSYKDYLRILLALLPQKTKLIRLMDIMQMNLTEKEGAAFAFRDFCYGVRIDARFEKKMHVLGFASLDKRRGNVTVSVKYK